MSEPIFIIYCTPVVRTQKYNISGRVPTQLHFYNVNLNSDGLTCCFGNLKTSKALTQRVDIHCLIQSSLISMPRKLVLSLLHPPNSCNRYNLIVPLMEGCSTQRCPVRGHHSKTFTPRRGVLRGIWSTHCYVNLLILRAMLMIMVLVRFVVD